MRYYDYEGGMSQNLNLGLKPVFHWNLPLRRLIFALPTRKKVHKQREMYMKCT